MTLRRVIAGVVVYALLLGLAASGWLYFVEGWRVAIARRYVEGEQFYEGLSLLWDGYEKHPLGVKAITRFYHSGVTLMVRPDGEGCISYYPLPYYRTLYEMYADEVFSAFSSQFVCLGRGYKVDSLLPFDQSLVFEADNHYLLPVSFSGLRFCTSTKCLWVYRVGRVRGKEYIPHSMAIELAIRSFDKAVWKLVYGKNLEGKYDPELVQKLLFPPSGIVVLSGGEVSLLAKEYDVSLLESQGLLKSWPEVMINAMPLKICGRIYSYTGASPSYQQAGRMVLHILFQNDNDCNEDL